MMIDFSSEALEARRHKIFFIKNKIKKRKIIKIIKLELRVLYLVKISFREFRQKDILSEGKQQESATSKLAFKRNAKESSSCRREMITREKLGTSIIKKTNGSPRQVAQLIGAPSIYN